MNRAEAIDLLKRHNEWRRGADIPMQNPSEIGEAIDLLINAEAYYTEQMRQLNDEWKENLEIQRKTLIDNACEWLLSQNLISRCIVDDVAFVKRFRKAMED